MDFKTKYQKITEGELFAFESLLKGKKLPEDYKKHMLKYNGGYPIGDYVGFDHEGDFVLLEYLNPIKYGGTTMEDYLGMDTVLPIGHIAIGIISGGRLSMSLNAEKYGEVYVSYEDAIPTKVSNSFIEFVGKLNDEEYEY